MNVAVGSLSTYLDLSFCHVEWKTADNNLAVLWSSLSRTGCGLDSGLRRLDGLLHTSNRRSFWLASAEVAFCLLLAINDAVERLIESCRHGKFGG